MALTINKKFVNELTDPSSAIFKQYQTDFEHLIEDSFIIIPGYVQKSAVVNKFRPGSVIADFSVNMTDDANVDFTKVEEQLTSNFEKGGYSVSGVSRSDEGELFSAPIYPLQSPKMTCKIEGTIKWTRNGNLLSNQKEKYEIVGNTLTLIKAEPSDSGKYACSGFVGGVPYEQWQLIKIQPYPNIQATDSISLPCDKTVDLKCCADKNYKLEWSRDDLPCLNTSPEEGCIKCTYDMKNCLESTVKCQVNLTVLKDYSYSSKTITISVAKKDPDCLDPKYGAGTNGNEKEAPCEGDMLGTIKIICENKFWIVKSRNCVPSIITDLGFTAQHLQEEDVGKFVADLSNATATYENEIQSSPNAVIQIATILKTIANTVNKIPVNKPIMTYFLTTMDVIGSDQTNNTWITLNKDPEQKNKSSELLASVESMGKKLLNETIEIKTNTSYLRRTNFSQSFHETSTQRLTQIDIPETSTLTFITTIVFSSLNKVLPVRTSTISVNDSSRTGVIINGDVAAVMVDNPINNISLTFDIENVSSTLGNPQCVFWNFSLLGPIGGWDSTGCKVKYNTNQTVTCECSHTTSFSILMSPFVSDSIILDFITYIGVGISIICLILSLIIEGIIWKSMTRNDTSYMRHVSIVNIAVSLLIADICFLIGAGIVKKGEPVPVGCNAVTFFMHFFYLTLFFWMLLSALLLLYRTVVVFAGMSRTKMMIIAFFVGYGAPLLIAVITVAATAGRSGYIIKQSACWLNWDETKASLAFVIPALTIVVINLVVLAVVLYKTLRSGVGAVTQPDEKHAIMVIARCVAILTPLFGLTWGFGIGTMVSGALGIHIVFAILNSLQGFFILVFGILLDNKIRDALRGKLSLVNISSNRTRSTSAGPSSSSGFPFLRRLRQRNGYNISESSGNSAVSSSSNSDTYINT